ncbi:Protein mahjong [Pseudolycoriella hygida]|uniref:Protein mahjong n=1 Tax=Pseudolycoriella hygida TaxID=35572 RepID=A0A9Q0NAG3_9DIPT|nr:Protein mahjong [Pseudolycoriella hygida]
MHDLCLNFAGRYSRRQQGNSSRRLDRQYVHSHCRVVRTIRSHGTLTCCDFTPSCTSSVVVGMTTGKVKLYNSKSGNEYITHDCHADTIKYVKCSKDGTLLLTSSCRSRPLSKMWNIEQNQLSMKLHFDEDKYLEFSNLNEDKIVGTRATVGDGNRSKRRTKNGVLWDVRSGEEVHKFDVSNQTFSGVFCPNALEIVSDDKVWDMRTLRLLRTVPELQGSIVKFSPQNVIYAVESKTRHVSGFNPKRTFVFLCDTFRTLDGYNYSTIKIENVGRGIYDLSVNKDGSEIALVGSDYADSVLSIYSVGNRKEEDDEDDTDVGKYLRWKDIVRFEKLNGFEMVVLPCASSVVVGMVGGKVKVYDSKSGKEYITQNCHADTIRYVKCNKDGTLLLTSSCRSRPLSKMWNIEGNQFSMMLRFDEDEYLEFSNLNEDKILATRGESATIYDTKTGLAITSYKSFLGNVGIDNRATFSPSDDLILSDGVLWDVRSREEVHRFDMTSETLPGVFHPNGLEIILNDKVYDTRTIRLLKTVPELNDSIVTFSPQNVIYGRYCKTEKIGENCTDSLKETFNTLDSYDFSIIKTVDAGRKIFDLSVNEYGSQIALVENSVSESAMRLYNVGSRKVEHDGNDNITELGMLEGMYTIVFRR